MARALRSFKQVSELYMLRFKSQASFLSEGQTGIGWGPRWSIQSSALIGVVLCRVSDVNCDLHTFDDV